MRWYLPTPFGCSRVRRAPTIHTYIVELSSSNQQAAGLITRLGHALLSEARAVALSDLFEPLEKDLASNRISVLSDAAGQPGATAVTVVDAVLRGLHEAKQSTSGQQLEGEAPLATSAVVSAFNQEAFRRVARLVAASDVITEEGRRETIGAGFDGECMLSVRTLLAPRASLCKSNETLAVLQDMHPHLPAYLTFIVACDESGTVPEDLKEFSILGNPFGHAQPDGTFAPDPKGAQFMQHLCALELCSVDWVFAPGGVLALEAVRRDGKRGASATDVHVLDIYTRLDIVQLVITYIHRVIVGLGGSKTVDDPTANGYTFAQFGEMYVEHISRCLLITDLAAQYRHLDRCHELFVAALMVLSRVLQAAIFSGLPAKHSITGGLLHADQPPISDLIVDREALQDIRRLKRQYGVHLSAEGLSTGAVGTSSSSFEIPRRSTNPELKTSGPKTSRPNDRGRHESELPHKPPKGKQQQEGEGAQPGSLTAAHLWISDKELYISGAVWFIDKLAKRLKVSPRGKCWPWILSLRKERNKPGQCEAWGTSGHRHADDAAHRLDQPIDVAALKLDASVCRAPTEAEVEKLREQMRTAGLLQGQNDSPAGRGGRGRGGRSPSSSPGRGKGNGKGRGGRGRGRGRAGGRQGFGVQSD